MAQAGRVRIATSFARLVYCELLGRFARAVDGGTSPFSRKYTASVP